jgi:hypothetical protein
MHAAAIELGQCNHIEQHACAMFDERVHVGNATGDRMRTADMGQATCARNHVAFSTVRLDG